MDLNICIITETVTDLSPQCVQRHGNPLSNILSRRLINCHGGATYSSISGNMSPGLSDTTRIITQSEYRVACTLGELITPRLASYDSYHCYTRHSNRSCYNLLGHRVAERVDY